MFLACFLHVPVMFFSRSDISMQACFFMFLASFLHVLPFLAIMFFYVSRMFSHAFLSAGKREKTIGKHVIRLTFSIVFSCFLTAGKREET